MPPDPASCFPLLPSPCFVFVGALVAALSPTPYLCIGSRSAQNMSCRAPQLSQDACSSTHLALCQRPP